MTIVCINETIMSHEHFVKVERSTFIWFIAHTYIVCKYWISPLQSSSCMDSLYCKKYTDAANVMDKKEMNGMPRVGWQRKDAILIHLNKGKWEMCLDRITLHLRILWPHLSPGSYSSPFVLVGTDLWQIHTAIFGHENEEFREPSRVLFILWTEY